MVWLAQNAAPAKTLVSVQAQERTLMCGQGCRVAGLHVSERPCGILISVIGSDDIVQGKPSNQPSFNAHPRNIYLFHLEKHWIDRFTHRLAQASGLSASRKNVSFFPLEGKTFDSKTNTQIEV